MACPCCGVAIAHPQLLAVLEQLRTLACEELGKEVPLYLNSGFRCTLHNAELPGSSPYSQHCVGRAADVRRVANLSVERLAELAERIPLLQAGGLGSYPWGIHVDVRGYRARWRYS
jgi:uncharacterized protein YcbK (DUF882 family)